MFKIIRTYVGRFVPFILACVVLVFVQVFCELKLPDLMSDIVNDGIVHADVSYIVQVGLEMLLWALLSMAAIIISAACSAYAAMGFGRDVRSAVFRKVEGFSLREFNGFGTSSLITRATNDVQQLERFLHMFLSIALMAPFMFFGAAAMAWIKSVQLSAIVFFTIPVILVIVAVMVKIGVPLLRSLQQRIDQLNLVTRENLTGMRVIRAYNKVPRVTERFAKANGDLADTNIKVARLMGILIPAISFSVNLAIVVIIWVGGQSIYAGDFLVGDLMAIIQYATMVLISVMMLSIIFTIAPRALAAGDRIREVLDTPLAIVDSPHPSTVTATERGLLTFEDVTFAFDDAENPSLEGISFTFEPGKTTAIIGSTGSGKSTLINLIMRFFEPTQGRILLDGCDITTMTQEDLRMRVALVPQRPQLFSGTVEENILVGRPGATHEEVMQAARIAQASEFIEQREGGYESLVAQGGGNLSGGQRQRLAIARAIIRNAELYVFDDSFSALDFKTDALVRTALHAQMRDATVIIVAQRVSVAMDADAVIVLDEGRIVGYGTHEQLVESCEVYREIAASQLDEDDLHVADSATDVIANARGGAAHE